MKIALVHELLTMRGGAEWVLRVLADMYPDAPIYTLLYDEKKLGDWFPQERVIEGRKKSVVSGQWSVNHHHYLRKFPSMVESWDFSEYDLVISTSSAFAHGIITNGAPKHLSYIHAPARYLWDRTFDVQERASRGLLGPLKKAYLQRTFHKLRTWDAEASGRADKLLAASKDVQRRIELYWRKPSDIVYPPIDDFWLKKAESRKQKAEQYFLIVSTLVPYKRIDRAIEACTKLNLPLNIVGEGPDRKHLELMTNDQSLVTFLGYQSKETLKELYTNAQALIIPGEEDFCLTAIEAMACGTPVISYKAGGPLETIIEGETGTFFEDNLEDVLQNFNRSKYSQEACKARAQQFSREKFEKRIREAVATLSPQASHQ